jgi:hypothetical protein
MRRMLGRMSCRIKFPYFERFGMFHRLLLLLLLLGECAAWDVNSLVFPRWQCVQVY